MGVYYRLPWFPQETTSKVIAALNVILLLLGIVHIAYGGVIAKYVSYYDDPIFLLTFMYDNVKAAYVPQAVFFIIGGVYQIITSIIMILLALSYFGDFNHHRWSKVALALIIIEFAMNFTIAVLSSMSATFNKTFYSDYYDRQDFYKNTYLNNYVQYTLDYYRFTIAQAVITFVLALPLIVITLVALLDYALKQESSQARAEPTNVEIRENHHESNVKQIK